MKPLKTKMSITIDTDVAERVRALAEAQDRSASSYVNLVLKQHLNDLNKAAGMGRRFFLVVLPACGGRAACAIISPL